MKKNYHSARWFSAIAMACGVFALSLLDVSAQTAAPPVPPAQAPVAAASNGTNVTNGTNAPATPVVAGQPAPAARREETDVQLEPGASVAAPPGSAPQPPQPTSLATRINAALGSLRGQGTVVEQLAQRDRTIGELRQQVASQEARVLQMSTELNALRAERQQIEAALQGLQAQQTNVTDTVASLGFPASALPGNMDIDHAVDTSPKAVYAEWQRLKREGKPGEASAYRRKNITQLRAYAESQPQTF